MKRIGEDEMNALLFLAAVGPAANDSATPIAVAIVAAFSSLVVAIVALIGTVATAITSVRNARTAAEALRTSSETAATAALTNARTATYSSTVTAERSKWINALRANIALFSGKLRTLSYASEKGNIPAADELKAISEINELIPLIRMQLNPFGPIEKNIAALLEKLPNLATRPDGAKLRDYDDLFIEHCRWLLKAEWEKVKTEAGGVRAKIDEEEYLQRYGAFCEAEGKIK
ncbi:hypothetical protein [Bradyrhizobium sp. SZCCHNRI1073]|uniref:hypothetical protein n=1 Tax=Bradyrhizobium sp. SZCCHNRI1073 TaxID=3057280 RepID=UPI002915E0CB|nr:hypothetical protein [Bradyrhizobium sp. SZCCHNRI1073]